MGAFGNPHHARQYRERLQPKAREHLGFLEKHGDYVKRAKEHHRKQDQLKALRLRAATRNPDEFNFGMIRARMTPSGRHIAAQSEEKRPDERVLHMLKTQDHGYVRMQRALNARKLAALEEELALASAPFNGKPVSHIIFAADEEERDALAASEHAPAVAPKSAHPEPIGQTSGDLLDDLEAETRTQTTKPAGDVSRLRREAGIRRERVRMLDRLDVKLSTDRHLLRAGRREKVGTDKYGLSVYRWAPERKK